MVQSKLQLKVTPKQQAILLLLYRFRYLTRNHIQHFLHHKGHFWIQSWLNDFVASHCIRQVNTNRFVNQPIIYALDTEGRKYLKSRANIRGIKPELLDRVWRDKSLSDTFRQRCLLVADIYQSLLQQADENGAAIHFYTKTELHGINYLISPYPDAYFANEKTSGEIKRFFLDIFDTVPLYFIRQRIKQHVAYYESNDWQSHTDNPFPAIILIFPNERMRKTTVGYIQYRLANAPDLRFLFTTRDLVKQEGLQSKILQRVGGKE